MKRCKDCIHFCVCSPYTAPNESYPEVDGCKCFRATADVAPRAEVAREIFEEIYEDCFDQFGYINYEALAELKKKYTEEKKDEN